MTMQTAAYGRLGADAKPIQTKTGKPMTAATLAVDIGEEDAPLWLGVVAFGRQAELLARHKKGELLSVAGRIQRNRWTQNGEEREQLQVVADSVIGSRTVRPGGRKKDTKASNDWTGVAAETFEDDAMPEFA